MKYRDISALVFSTLLLGGCGEQWDYKCLKGNDFNALLKTNRPSALDGYDYVLCPEGENGSCDEDNILVSLRPAYLRVSISKGDIFVYQVGGSVKRFKSDPIGMFDANYESSHHIFFEFSPEYILGSKKSGVEGFVDGQRANFNVCGSK